MLSPGTLIGTQSHVKALTAATEVLNNGNPFSALNKVNLLAPGTPTIYGVNRVADQFLQVNNQGSYGVGSTGKPRYLRIIADGSATTWTSTDYPALINGHDDGAAITDAIRLANVLVVNGVIKHRVQSDAAPAASQWKIALSGGVYTLTAKSAANGAYAAGTVLEFYMATAADIVTQGPLVAGTLIEGTCYDFMLATTAAAMFADRL
jgi:hypothetical protein